MKPAEGSKQWWSDMGDDLKNTLTRSVDLTGKAKASLELSGWWDIEADYDYLYTEVSTDGGASWTPVDGTADGKAITRDASDKPALTGVSGAYKKLVFPLDAYAGKKVDVRFRYQTDGGAGGKGFAADAITVNADGAPLFTDNAEGDDAGWTSKGFSRIGESFTQEYEQYYLAENRQYVSYDKTLKVGPYNFGFKAPKDGWVEHYPYQNGLLIWLWDTSQKDNNTSAHPGQGLVLPIDAHPDAAEVGRRQAAAEQDPGVRRDVQLRTDRQLHAAQRGRGAARSRRRRATRSSTTTRVSTGTPRTRPASVKVTDTNTRISIVSEPKNGEKITVKVGPSTK